MTPPAGEDGVRRAAPPGFALVLTLALIGLACGVRGRITRPLPLPARDAPLVLESAWPDMRLDINEATAAEMIALPGVGPRLAERIVANRAASGPFGSVAELERVHRMGPKIVERLRPYAAVESSDRVGDG